MLKAEALAAIKALRDRIVREADVGPKSEVWELRVVKYLDFAGDLIDPKIKTKE